MADDALYADFLALSATLTGYPAFRLTGTGRVGEYLDAVSSIVGETLTADLCAAHRRAEHEAGGDEAALDRAIRHGIMSDERLGPVARRIVKLWYVGTWSELPPEWREANGPAPDDRTFVVSAEAYKEGLLWPTVGAGPSGAKPLGYGMWATPPRIEPV